MLCVISCFTYLYSGASPTFYGLLADLLEASLDISLIHKKGSVYNPINYRGVHLTGVLPNCVERLVGIPLSLLFEATNVFTATQWAFRKCHSCRDLVTLLISSWLLSISLGKKFVVCSSAISGALDRVDSSLLLSKLRRAGLNSDHIRFCWLRV